MKKVSFITVCVDSDVDVSLKVHLEFESTDSGHLQMGLP